MVLTYNITCFMPDIVKIHLDSQLNRQKPQSTLSFTVKTVAMMFLNCQKVCQRLKNGSYLTSNFFKSGGTAQRPQRAMTTKRRV